MRSMEEWEVRQKYGLLTDNQHPMHKRSVLSTHRSCWPSPIARREHSGDAVLSHQMALGVLDQSRAQQASSLAYFDVFWLCGVLGVALVLLVPLMKRSVAEKGAHVAAE